MVERLSGCKVRVTKNMGFVHRKEAARKAWTAALVNLNYSKLYIVR